MRGVRLPRWLRRGLRGALYIALGFAILVIAAVIAWLFSWWPGAAWLLIFLSGLGVCCIMKGLRILGIKVEF